MDSSDLFDDDDDDSLLKPIMFGKDKTRIESKQIIVVDESDDDIIVESTKSNLKISSPSTSISNGLTNHHDDGGDDSDIQIIEDQPANLPADQLFTSIKDYPTTSNISNDDDQWIELNDSDDSLYHSTPLFRMVDRNNRKQSINHKILSSKSNKKASKTLKNHIRPNLNKNLFNNIDDDDDSDGEQIDEQNRLTTKIQQKDVLNYTTVMIDSGLFDLAKQEIQTLFRLKNISYCEIQDELKNYCVRWKCHPELETMIRESNQNDNSLFKCMKILNNFLFNHLMILIQSNDLHEFLDSYLNDDQQQQTNRTNKLYDLIEKQCKYQNINNVTIIIYQMEKHLRLQQKFLDESFKRRINDMIVAETRMDSQKIAKQNRNKRQNNNNKRTWPYKHSMTMDNLDQLLIDCKFKFLYNFNDDNHNDQNHQTRSKLSFINVDCEQELANILFRYTRSIVEQIFRIDRQGRTNIEFFALSEKNHTIDPTKNDDCKRQLWLQQLLQFPNISNDIAEAIVNRFPRPLILFNKLKSSLSSITAINMLADIQSISNTNRKVGNELATKIYLFMISNNPDQILKTG